MSDFEILIFMVILMAILLFFDSKTGIGLFSLAAIGPVVYMTFTIGHPFFHVIAIIIIIGIFYSVFKTTTKTFEE